MNANQLIRHNLTRSINSRVSLAEIESRKTTARLRGNHAALQVSIHNEIAAQKLTNQNKFARMDNWTGATPYERNTHV